MERHILRFVRASPKATYKELQKGIDREISKSTYYRILKKYNITNWRAKKRPALTPAVAKLRLKWAKQHVMWTQEQWSKVIWSDECSVERGTGKDQVWCFRTPQQKWQKQMIQTYPKGKEVRQMIWAAFSGKFGRCNLVVMQRDEATKKKSYTAQSYIEAIEDELPRMWEPDLLFLQDNAPIHTAKIVKAWLQQNLIQLIEIPPYSPDLNLIENQWPHLKKNVYKVNPDIEKLGKGNSQVQELLGEALIGAWQLIPESYFKNAVLGMKQRCEAVIEAKGWHTRY